ncbi:DUF3160 domain-containing protein [Spirochaeta cellobiosiphila]|uniref:DUF3160 domain-containing protein n=1 Tax=Spirochaeta cellobiosiphila TaxID=504483 RepID=UPI000408F40F|nr:DUF3160 domain-containing protein [Spirochaeta cellobiosiphila]
MNKIKTHTLISLFFIVLLSMGCQKETAPVEEITTPVVTEEKPAPKPKEEEIVKKVETNKKFNPLPSSDFDWNIIDTSGRIKAAEAHAQYLDDEFSFLPLPVGPDSEETAVVGSQLGQFYPHVDSSNGVDTSSLRKGIPLPLGTIIPILGRVNNPDDTYYGMYVYEDDYNYFYLTKYEDQEGIIWGADLAGLNQSPQHNQITAQMYQNKNHYDQFPQFIGSYLLNDEEKSYLLENKMLIQKVKDSEYSLSLQRPDDMLSLYIQEARDKQAPIFISTDLIAQGLHLFFDKFLQYTEENQMAPRLTELNKAYLKTLETDYSSPTQEDSLYGDAYQGVLTYFQVADCLMALAPKVEISDDYRRTVTYAEVDQDAVISSYPQAVREEVKLIMEANQAVLSPNFNYEEDYTQYKPRGHYTKNGILSAYFRCMMWYGRLHFYMSAGNPPDSSLIEISTQKLPMVALINDMTVSRPSLFEEWKALFDPITDLIGASDDLSFYDVSPFFEGLAIDNLQTWIDSVDQVRSAVDLAGTTLRKPLISGNSVFDAPSDNLNPPLGWRLFGQRFTWDSYVHEKVSPPRLMSRDIVRGLDIMKAFGSDTADRLLMASDYPEMEGLENKLDELEAEFYSKSDDFWSSNYYNSTLNMIRTQARFDSSMGFYFTQSPLYGVKAMLSSHGTWAALRHDTILYVKQVYAERAGDGDYEPTFRIEKIPHPIHYIEPNIPFYKGALEAIRGIYESGSKYGFLDENYVKKIKDWNTLLTRITKIVQLEYKDESVSDEDVLWIRTIPQQLMPLVTPPDSGYASYLDDPTKLRGAIIADVFTNSELGVALEVGTGIPYRLLVALDDGQGGMRIATGYTFSYYEFLVPQNKRMTNEEWRAIVYPFGNDLSQYEPFWIQGVPEDPRK